MVKKSTFKLPSLVIYSILLIFLGILFSPQIVNAYQNIQTLNPYKIAYSSFFSYLNEINPILTEISDANENKTNKDFENRIDVSDINFAQNSAEQEKFNKNEFSQKSNIQAENPILKIKSVEIEGPIVDGQNESALNNGFWYIPISSYPGQRGNTVIIAHRFLKIPPSKDTFYNLDKVNLGDQIEITLKNQLLSYTVVEKKIITPDQREVIYPTTDYRLTLITCTPLWHDTNRLIVIATLNRTNIGI